MTPEEPDLPRRNHGWAPLVVILVVLVAATGIALVLTHSDSGGGGGDTADCKDVALTAEVDLRPAVRTDEPAKLAAAADILSRRLSVYGCSKVQVVGDRLHVSTSADGEKHLDELMAPGELQFREVLETTPGGQCLPVTNIVPADATPTACSQDGTEQYRLGPAKVVGTDIEGAAAQRDQQLGQWQVIVHFTASGQRKWTALTRETVGKRLAMVLDGVVISAPTIQEQIDGDAQISGSFTEDNATALARTLQLGVLPIPLVRA